MKYPLVSIIILNWNQLTYLKQCLSSLIENTEYPNFEIIILDNGSKEPGTKDYLQNLPFRVIYNSKNLGYAKGNNLAAKYAKGEYLLFLNNDTLAHKNWLSPLVEVMNERKDCGIAGSKLLYPDGNIQHLGVAFDWRGNRRHIYKNYPADIPPAQEIRECEAVTGACFIIRQKIFEEVGGFDERFKNGSEDIDLCLKVRARGYRIFLCPDSVLTHFEKTSLKTRGNFYKKWSTKYNNYLFQKKWGQHLDEFRIFDSILGLKAWNYYANELPEILPLIPDKIELMLDVGCRLSSLTEKLKSKKTISIWGMNVEPINSFKTKNDFVKYIKADEEKIITQKLDLPLFDCLIFIDILEHFREPGKVLKKLKESLKDNGRIILSISNIRHYTVIKDILRNRWLYRENGIFEVNHLRFFSWPTIKRMLKMSGYQIEKVKIIKKSSLLMKLLNYFFFGNLDDFLTQQYLIVAKKVEDWRDDFWGKK